MLQPLGIGEFDEGVYRAFLTRADLRPQEYAGTAGVSPDRVRRAVARLVGLGLLRPDGSGGHRPVGPGTALTALLNQRRLETETAFTAIRSTVEELEEEYRAGRLRTDPGSLVEVLSGRDVVAQRIDELNQSVSTHVWTLDRPPYHDRADGLPHTNEAEKASTAAWARRGVDIRSVYCPESMERPGRFETVLEMVALGEQARMLPSLPFKLHIIDRRVGLVPLVGGAYDTLAVVHPSGLLDALIELYEAYWDKAAPVGAPAPVAVDEGPTSEEIALLTMLRAGLKDQAVARQLGLSTRTATRRIAALMARLDATTRFQAGVEARARGWI
ncbi:LuxR C-terminal-related transcriptional regulator [Streptomyces sp. ME03-5709C]|nr:LuxR C-terminal-related transcriptional regulator [Streptomyces sp. ME03-5709C]